MTDASVLPAVLPFRVAGHRFDPPTMPVPAGHGFLSRYTIPRGITLFRETGGVWVENPYPTLSELKTRTEGVDCFLGGRVYEVSAVIWNELVASGWALTEGYGGGFYGEGKYGA